MPLDVEDDSWIPENRPALREAMTTLRKRRVDPDATDAEPVVPAGLFDGIVGHQGQKRVLLRALESSKPVHVLMVGPPGTAKTEFLLALKRLRHSRYATGASISQAGLFQYLQQHPDTQRLLIDEIDKAQPDDLWLLLELLQSGTISRLKHERQESLKRPEVQVFAAANSIEKLPEPLVSRFVLLSFPPYDREQFVHVVSVVLQRREGLSPARAQEIAEAVAERSRDPRDAIKIGRLAGQSAELAPILDEVLPLPKATEPPRPRSLTGKLASTIRGGER